MSTIGKYEQTLSRQYPGLFVVLLDQSVSMTEKESKSGQTKAEIVTTYVNSILRKMIEYAPIDEFTGRRKNYVYVCVLGYNDDVYPLLASDTTPVSLPDLDDNAKGFVTVDRVFYDQRNRPVKRVKEKVKVWIEPKAEGNTDMTYAFEEAEKVIKAWLYSTPEYISQDLGMQQPRSKSFPPVLINITDAKHNGEREPDEVVDRIRAMSTEQGNVLIYNCHFTHESGQDFIFFPSNIDEVRRISKSNQAQKMFYMSSIIPDALLDKARHDMQMPIEPGARCFVYNSNPDILLKFLKWTTFARLGRP